MTLISSVFISSPNSLAGGTLKAAAIFSIKNAKETQRYFNRVFKTSESNNAKVMFSLPEKGLFIVDIFFKKHGEKKSWL